MTDYTKLDAYPALTLIKGSGKTYEQGFCVMQAVAWFAGEAHTDRPQCASPALAAFAIALNDRLPDYKRQRLRKLIAPMTGTRSDEHEDMRIEYLVRRVAHDIVAPVFEKRWPQHAEAIRKAQTRLQLNPVLKAAEKDARRAAAAAAAAAYAYAYAAAAADAADAAAYAAYAYAYAAGAGARAKIEDIMIDILDGAIRLGPNGGDDLTPYAERVHEMGKRGFLNAQETV